MPRLVLGNPFSMRAISKSTPNSHYARQTKSFSKLTRCLRYNDVDGQRCGSQELYKNSPSNLHQMIFLPKWMLNPYVNFKTTFSLAFQTKSWEKATYLSVTFIHLYDLYLLWMLKKFVGNNDVLFTCNLAFWNISSLIWNFIFQEQLSLGQFSMVLYIKALVALDKVPPVLFIFWQCMEMYLKDRHICKWLHIKKFSRKCFLDVCLRCLLHGFENKGLTLFPERSLSLNLSKESSVLKFRKLVY